MLWPRKLRPSSWAAALAPRLARSPLANIVVEANPELIPTLEINRRLNRCEFQIRSAALAYGGAETVLAIGSWVVSVVGGRGTRQVMVATTTLAQLLRESVFAHISL